MTFLAGGCFGRDDNLDKGCSDITVLPSCNCGYDLSPNSSSRNTSTIGSKYGKSSRKGTYHFSPLVRAGSIRSKSSVAHPTSSPNTLGIFSIKERNSYAGNVGPLSELFLI